MNKFWMSIGVFFVALPWSNAKELAVISAIGFDGQNNIIAATVKYPSGFEAQAQLLELDTRTSKSTSIALPQDWHGREVIAVFANKQSVLVWSQWKQGGGDAPRYSTYDRAKKTWSPIKKAGCVHVADLAVQKDRVEFRCEDPGTGSPISQTVAVSVPGVERPLTIHLPQSEAALGDEGNAHIVELNQIEITPAGPSPRKRKIKLP